MNKELFNEYMKLVKEHDFYYQIYLDLERWKKNINHEYLIRKKLKEVFDEYGLEYFDRIKTATVNNIKNDMMYSYVIPRTIDSWFLPYQHLIEIEKKSNKGPSKYQLYSANQNKLHDKPSEELKSNSKGYQ